MKVTEEIILKIIASITAIITGGYGVYATYLKAKVRHKDNFPKHFKIVSDVLNELRKVVNNGGAQRALILIMENGGGSPSLRTPLYSSILYEAYPLDLQPMQRNWYRRLIDSQYLENMRKVEHSNGRPYVFNQNDFKGSDVYDVYCANDVICSQVAEIYKGETFYIYCSFNYNKSYKDLESNEKNLSMQVISNLQGLFKSLGK